MSTFIVTTDGRLSEHDEHVVLQNKNVIRITASSYLVRNYDSAISAINTIAPTDEEKSHLRPWFVFQISKPWNAQGAEQNYVLTHQKVIAFLRAYPEGMKGADNSELENLSDNELDNLAEWGNP